MSSPPTWWKPSRGFRTFSTSLRTPGGRWRHIRRSLFPKVSKKVSRRGTSKASRSCKKHVVSTSPALFPTSLPNLWNSRRPAIHRPLPSHSGRVGSKFRNCSASRGHPPSGPPPHPLGGKAHPTVSWPARRRRNRTSTIFTKRWTQDGTVILFLAVRWSTCWAYWHSAIVRRRRSYSWSRTSWRTGDPLSPNCRPARPASSSTRSHTTETLCCNNNGFPASPIRSTRRSGSKRDGT
mmetsp:Transcript_32083/g.89810  ORF Transcript_32083/g.89810 Transcript_32083/m.89810 type:complete len:236 (-) Transcript_32083:1004-1711(-)